ncbi:MAG: hypothetical protein V9F04_04545 [Dermatophilaceae bacterium]
MNVHAIRAAAVAAAVTLTLTGCAGRTAVAQPGETLLVDGIEITVTGYSAGPSAVQFAVTGMEDGSRCPGPGEVQAELDDGSFVTLDRATSWSCTTVRRGEVTKAQLIGDEAIQGVEKFTWLGPDGKPKATWRVK